MNFRLAISWISSSVSRVSRREERQMDEYTDLKEYIAVLTRGKLLMCNVCRIEFPPNKAEFRIHVIGDMKNFPITKFVKKILNIRNVMPK